MSTAAQRREALHPWLTGERARRERELLGDEIDARRRARIDAAPRLSRAEARSRARRRWREKRGLSVSEHNALIARRGPTEVVRRSTAGSLVSKPRRATDSGGDDGFSLTGYATTYDQPYSVDSYYEGEFTEVIARGAFTASLRKSTPVMLFDHGQDVRTGSVPIAAVKSVTEDRTGLRVRAKLFNNSAVEPVRQAIAGGAIRGMSIMMRVTDDVWTRGAPGEPDTRTIRKAILYEAGPVVWPANSGTSVGVRSAKARKGRHA